MLLTPEEQRHAIARLANSGMSERTIAAATMLTVEMVRKILAEVREATP